MLIRLLIVDTRIGEFAYDLQQALERAGAETLVARHVPAALSALRRFGFDAVLVGELGKPAESLQVLRDACAVPVVPYTGCEVAKIVQAAMQAIGHGQSQ